MTRMKISATDTAAWAAGSWQAIPQTTLTGSAANIGGRVRDIAAHGITEIITSPSGPTTRLSSRPSALAARSATSAA